MNTACSCPPKAKVGLVTLTDLSHPLSAAALRVFRQRPDFPIIYAPTIPQMGATPDLLAGISVRHIVEDTPVEPGHVYMLPCCAEYLVERDMLKLLRFPFPEQKVHPSAGLADDTYRRLRRDAAIISALTDGLVIADPDGNILEMNAAAMHFHGLCSEDETRLSSDQYASLFPLRTVRGELVPVEQSPLRRVTRRECFQGLTYCLSAKDLPQRYLNFAGTPVHSEGRFSYAILTIREVTEEERARQRLIESEVAFKAAIENYPTPFVIYDADQRIEFMNRAAIEACGRPLDDLIGLCSEELNKSETVGPYLPLLAKAYETKELQQAEIQIFYKGESCDLQMTFVPILDELGEVRRTLGITNDLTDTHKAKLRIEALNSQLEAQARQLRQTVCELESFSYAVAHDLLAPLRAMVGYAQVLCEDYASTLDAEGQSFARRIESAGLHMGRLLDDILRLSRVSVQEFTATEVDLVRLAHSALCEIEADFSRFTLRVPSSLPERGDEGLLKLALKNLLSNAIKYSRTQPQPLLEIGIRKESGRNVYFIRDNGVGFDQADARNLFKPFSRLHDKSQFEGNGIGLAIVRRAIERHGGQVWAESALGEGSTFSFTLGKD